MVKALLTLSCSLARAVELWWLETCLNTLSVMLRGRTEGNPTWGAKHDTRKLMLTITVPPCLCPCH